MREREKACVAFEFGQVIQKYIKQLCIHTHAVAIATAVTDLSVSAADIAAAAVIIIVVAAIATTCPTYVTLYAFSSGKCLCACEGALSVLIIRCLKMILHVSAYGYGFLWFSFSIRSISLLCYVEKKDFLCAES